MVNDDISSLKINRGEPSSREEKGGKKMGIVLLCAAICATVGALFLFMRGENLPEVEVLTISTRPGGAGGTQLLNAGGYIVAKRETTLGAKIIGEIIYLGVEEGDRIKSGQVLARIKSDDIKAQLSREEASLEKAQNNYQRGKQLFEKGLLSKSDMDELNTSLKIATATVILLQAQLAETTITAPFDGIVIKKYADVGNMIMPEKDILRAIDTSEWFAEVDISEDDISKVRIGQHAEVTAKAYPDKTFKAEVVSKIPKQNDKRGGGVVTVKLKLVDLAPTDLALSNIAARVAFLKSVPTAQTSKPAISIPLSAVVGSGEKAKVVVVSDGVAHDRPVKLGKADGERVEIVGGLSDGDQVIVSSLDKISDGGKVKIK